MKMTMKKSTLMSIRRQTFHLPTAVVYHVEDISNKTLYTFTFCKCSRSAVSQLKCAKTGRLLQLRITFSRKALTCTLSTWNILLSVFFCCRFTFHGWNKLWQRHCHSIEWSLSAKLQLRSFRFNHSAFAVWSCRLKCTGESSEASNLLFRLQRFVLVSVNV